MMILLGDERGEMREQDERVVCQGEKEKKRESGLKINGKWQKLVVWGVYGACNFWPNPVN